MKNTKIIEKESREGVADFLNFCESIGFWQQTETGQITEDERRFDE